MRISIVIPVLNEKENIQALSRRLIETLDPLYSPFEIIFVDDGSSDETAALIAGLHSRDARIKLLSLTRHFGYGQALTAGLDYAEGDAVITMDGDLQHPPSLIPEMLKRWKDGAEIVHTIRRTTGDASYAKAAFSRFFYALYRGLTGTRGFRNTSDFRLMDRNAVLALRACRERARFVRGLSFWIGFRASFLEFDAPPRRHGRTKFALKRMFRLAADGIFSFSPMPLFISFYAGIFSFLFGVGYAAYAAWIKFVSHQAVIGWASTIIVMAILGGLQMLFMGIQGIYISRIFEEVKQRPIYLLRSSLGIKTTVEH